MQRVQKTGGSNVGEVIYFNGHPIARLTSTSSGSALNWTSDLLWVGDSLLAELGQSTTYRLLDHEGSLALATDGSGNVLGANVLTPYGQNMNEQLSDAYTWAGLFQDTEYSGHAARYRDYSGRAARWLTPDPYNGSYDLYNPQSFNRYMYVNGNPLGFTDPSGKVDGWATGFGGSPCSVIDNISSTTGLSPEGFNFCNPVASAITFALSPFLVPIADQIVSGVNSIFGTTYDQIVTNGVTTTSVSIAAIVPYIAAAITIACSIDNNTAACGPSGLTSLIPGFGGDLGKVAGDGIAVGTAISCSMGGLSNPVCDGFVVYNIANAVYSFFNSLFNGGAQFNGSLLPRPGALGGLGSSAIGIPDNNLSLQEILGQPSHRSVPSPGMKTQ